MVEKEREKAGERREKGERERIKGERVREREVRERVGGGERHAQNRN